MNCDEIAVGSIVAVLGENANFRASYPIDWARFYKTTPRTHGSVSAFKAGFCARFTNRLAIVDFNAALLNQIVEGSAELAIGPTRKAKPASENAGFHRLVALFINSLKNLIVNTAHNETGPLVLVEPAVFPRLINRGGVRGGAFV